MRTEVLGVLALGLFTAACGSNGDQRAATRGPAGIDAGTSALAESDFGTVEGSGPVRRAQSELKREGLYDGRVDGIAGPKTVEGISAFQQRERLPQTARLDRATRDRMIVKALRMDGVPSARARGNAASEGSGSSMPPSANETPWGTDASQHTDGIGTSRHP
jgi:peptidoglycan hydrolase-like protein with peptidoglycan-binding domain